MELHDKKIVRDIGGITAAAATIPTVKHYLLRNLINHLYAVEYQPVGGHAQKKSGRGTVYDR